MVGIYPERGEGQRRENNRTLAAWSRKIEMEEKDEDDEEDATTLPLAVEERKSGVNGNGYNNEEEDLKQRKRQRNGRSNLDETDERVRNENRRAIDGNEEGRRPVRTL